VAVKSKSESRSDSQKFKSIGLAILAASLYGISAPVSKLLLVELSPTFMAALLYLGAGFGMLMVNVIKIIFKRERLEARMTRRELPYVISMILLDIAAPIFLMLGLTLTTSSTASLLNNFEIVATSMIALFIFHEAVGKRMWVAIALITLSSVILSVDDFGSLSFSMGSLFVVLACICWGFENNCTRMLSLKDPLQIVVVKGFGSGLGAFLITWYRQDISGSLMYVGVALILGFIAYGLSIYFYIKAQRALGAARTSAYYAAAPFIGVIISWIFLKENITNTFLVSLGIMLLGTYFAVSEDHAHKHIHEKARHEHKHSHDDGHHGHNHTKDTGGNNSQANGQEHSQEHSHEHVHDGVEHVHKHTPDIHHGHSH